MKAIALIPGTALPLIVGFRSVNLSELLPSFLRAKNRSTSLCSKDTLLQFSERTIAGELHERN